MSTFYIRPVIESDREWIGNTLELRWGSRRVVSKGRLFDPEKLDGLVAIRGGRPVGLLTFRFENSECEVVALDSFLEGQGVGSSVLIILRGINQYPSLNILLSSTPGITVVVRVPLHRFN